MSAPPSALGFALAPQKASLHGIAPSPGVDLVTCYSVFVSLAGGGAFCVLVHLQFWTGDGSQWSCPFPSGR